MAQKGIKIAILTLILVAVTAPLCMSADEPAPPQPDSQRGDRQQMGDRQRGGFDRDAMQERMMSMMKERLGATDEEWTVIKPRLSKVMELHRTSSGMSGMMRGMYGGRRGRGNRPDFMGEESAVDKAASELQDTLEKDSPTTAEIKAKLTALRGAKEKAKAELAEAQKSLREVLSLKQEAQLVMMAMLD